MKDKLTKKRIKVDYESMIIYLKLDGDFVRYVFEKNSKISSRRTALAFLRSKKVDIQGVYYEMKQKGLQIDDDNSNLMYEIPVIDTDSSNKLDENRDSRHEFHFDDSTEFVDNTPDWMK